MNSLNPDVVIVGGGPVGLWTAIQTKLLAKDKEFLVVEQYEKYQRDQIRLRIAGSSLHTVVSHEKLLELTAKWADRIVPISEMEESLNGSTQERCIERGTAIWAQFCGTLPPPPRPLRVKDVFSKDSFSKVES